MKNTGSYVTFSFIFLNFVTALFLTNVQNVQLEAQPSNYVSTVFKSFKVIQDDINGLPDDKDNVTDILTSILSFQFSELSLPGGAVISIVKDGEIYLLLDYGMANNEESIPMESNKTLFGLDGISDVFTATVVMQLAEKGVIDLNENINTYLTAFKIPDTFKDPITMSHLLTHTAGFETISKPTSSSDLDTLLSLEEFLVEAMPNRVRSPGESSSYSSYSYALIGYIIEQVTGETYEEYVAQNIFEPMEMNYSTFEQPIPSQLEPFLAVNYLSRQGAFNPFRYYINPTIGSLYSSAADMAKFMIMQLNNGKYNGKTILDENSVTKILTDQFNWHSGIPGVSYGMYEHNIQNLTAFGHLGDTDGYHSVISLIPEEDLGIFIAYNNPFVSDVPLALFDWIISQYYPYNYINSTEATIEVHPDYKSRAGRYTGIYTSNLRNYSVEPSDNARIVVTSDRNGRLHFEIPIIRDFEEITFIETEPMLFREISGTSDLRVAFKEDKNGLIAYMSMNWINPTQGYDKLHPWYARSETELLLIAFMSLIFLISIFAYSYIAFEGFTSGGKIDNKLVTATRWYIVPLFAVIQLMIFSVNDQLTAKAVLITETDALFQNLSLQIILTIGFIIGGVILAILAWTGIGNNRKPYWGKGLLIHYSILIITSFSIIWLLLNWMLII